MFETLALIIAGIYGGFAYALNGENHPILRLGAALAAILLSRLLWEIFVTLIQNGV